MLVEIPENSEIFVEKTLFSEVKIWSNVFGLR